MQDNSRSQSFHIAKSYFNKFPIGKREACEIKSKDVVQLSPKSHSTLDLPGLFLGNHLDSALAITVGSAIDQVRIPEFRGHI